MKIAIGGMIASGKSTLVTKLSEALKTKKVDEFDPKDEVFSTLLKWLYEGKENVEMLLQIYFIQKAYQNQLKLNKEEDVVIDRHIIEHWLFAQTNLKNYPDVMNMYNALFHQYMTKIEQPDFYIILDMDWETFKERIMKRGRPEEIENFARNETYFRYLMDDYVEKLRAQCIIYNIPHIVLETSGYQEDEILEAALLATTMQFTDHLWPIDYEEETDEKNLD